MRKGPVPQPPVAPPSVCFSTKTKRSGREPLVCKENTPKEQPYAVHIDEMDGEQARGHAA